MGKPDAPQPPNPYQTAQAQTGTNVSTAVANQQLNAVNQVTPDGTLTYNNTGTYDWTDPSTGQTYSVPRQTMTQTLSPEGQAQKVQNDQTKLNLATMGQQQSAKLGSILGTPFNPLDDEYLPTQGQAMYLAGGPNAMTSFAPGKGEIQFGFGDAGNITKSYGPGNFSTDRSHVEDALMKRMDPSLTRERSNIETRLADQGIRYGSAAYTSAMDDYNRQANDARFAAVGQAGSEQQRMMDMAAQRAGFQNSAQQQQYDQLLGRATFNNQAQGQEFGQNLQRAQFNNAGLAQQLNKGQSVFNAMNSQRNQYLQEQYAMRNQPMNEISALLSGGAVQSPNWMNAPTSQIPTTDIGGLINQNFAQQSQNYQTANQNWQQMAGGILGLGAGVMRLSDEREKKNIDPVGSVFAYNEDAERKQLPIYEYEYKDSANGAGRQIGPMAQEVEKIDPKAVHNVRGRKMINTHRVMGNILRAAMTDSWFPPMVASGILGGTSPSSVQALRQKIALAMLMQKRKAPANLGEGLSAIGESLGDMGVMRRLESEAAAASAQTDKDIEADRTAVTPGAISNSAVPGARAESETPPPTSSVASSTPVFRPPRGTVGRPPAGTEVSEGNYGYNPPPPYLAAALERNVPDPERRAYLGHLAGKEARSANEVSSTGAAGPFQFTRGTGAAYGIPGDARFDQDASIAAVNNLTDDNASVLGKALGRPPTGPELALAHQQGAGTAAKMLLGTGNASARNLAVNKASGGPQEAAQKIMSYYAMPGSSGGPRDEAAAVLASRQPPPAGPAGPQDALLGEVTGMTGPTSALSFAPTANAGRIGDLPVSDAPSITGAMTGPRAAGVGDSVQQRQEGFQQPQAVPSQAGPQLAQAGPFPAPTLDASGRPAAIIPGGGLPQVMQQPIQAAPQDPRTAIRKAPDLRDTSDDPEPQPPTKPQGVGPEESRLQRQLYGDVDPRQEGCRRGRRPPGREPIATPPMRTSRKFGNSEGGLVEATRVGHQEQDRPAKNRRRNQKADRRG